MPPVSRQSLVEQTAAHLRDGFRSGRWAGHLPGVLRLATELGVSKDTLSGALGLLEAQGQLEPSVAGKKRAITRRLATRGTKPKLPVAVLLNEPLAEDNSYSQNLLLSLQQTLEAAGHISFFADKTLTQLDRKPERVARLMKATKADAWVVYAGSPQWWSKKQTSFMGG